MLLLRQCSPTTSIDLSLPCHQVTANISTVRMEPPMAHLSQRHKSSGVQRPTKEPSTPACARSIARVRHVASGQRHLSGSRLSLARSGRSHAGRHLQRSESMASLKDPRAVAAERRTRRIAKPTLSQATLASHLLMQALSAFQQALLFLRRPLRPSLRRRLSLQLLDFISILHRHA